ncbi:MAG: cell division protein FtsZ [Crocinitomicaceae bacterium]|nr:cell division protein FtsZ [Crocinitomicaceae bacterium]MCF8410726.1 cell division protein FtsZ [Crocinitomicaceae bacterium]
MEFDLPSSNSIIKVIGVGGGGSNAVNHMYNMGIIGVDFIVCNTDRQALDISPVPQKIQLGPSLTEGRGAGALPEVGMQAANENIEEIRELLGNNTKLVFVTAGLGGGTGTGAAPVIAQVAKDLGILTVGIVTVPFSFEGKKRRQQAEDGLEKMRENVDTLLVINNERLHQLSKNCTISQAFGMADDILTVAAKGIAELISVTGYINVDFNDVNTVMRNSGHAIMGSAYAEGEDRALIAIKTALTSPLLNDNNIDGARYVLLNITFGDKELTMDEISVITDFIQNEAGANAEVIWGYGNDNSLGDKINITLIATGFSMASTPVHGLEKPAEINMISLEDDLKNEINSPLGNPMASVTSISSFPTRETIQPSTPVSNPIADYSSENIVNSTENDESITRFELTMEESKLEETKSQEPVVNEIASVESATNVEFDWDVADSVNDFVSSESITNNEPVKSIETPEVIKFDLVDEEEPTVSFAKSSLSPEEQQTIAQERFNRIRTMTTKLKNADGINEFENEPAYVRRNLQINDSNPSTEKSFSRFGLSDDTNGNTTLRGNSFLHDNVD